MAKDILAYDDFVMKQKPLIDAEVEKAHVVKTSYSEKEHDLLNALLYTLQTKTFNQNTFDFWENQTDIDSRTFVFAESELRKLARIKDTSNEALKDVIRGIRDKRLEIKNFIVSKEIDGEIKAVKQHYVGSMIESAVFEKIGKIVSVKLQLSPIFVLLARRDYNISHGNFALIPYSQTKEMSGLVPKRLIEWASKYDGYDMLLRANEETLERICGKQPAFAHYKRILTTNFLKVSNLAEFKIILWNSKLRFTEMEVSWKIERPGIKKEPFANLQSFIKFVREKYPNQLLYNSTEGEGVQCSENGLLYDVNTGNTFSTGRAKELWNLAFEYQKEQRKK